jgi:hypothetical protein
MFGNMLPITSESEMLRFRSTRIQHARATVKKIIKVYRKPWTNPPGSSVSSVLTGWMINATRHMQATTILAEQGDLVTVADAHYRPMFEILLQVRFFLSFDAVQRERLARKIEAWGVIDYLDNMTLLKDHELVKASYAEMQAQLQKYDPDLVNEIERERSQRQWYWFGKSFSSLAENVSQENEDLLSVYRIISGQLHGSWDVTLGIPDAEMGILEFHDYPDKKTLYYWAAELVERASSLCVQIWNAIGVDVGAPLV